MSGTSPEAILYDSNGNLLAVQNGSAIPASTPGLLVMGSDGTNSRYVAVDSSGNQILVGAGTAGTPAGGVVSIQGTVGGQTVPISGSVSITGTVGVTQSTSPWVSNISQFGGSNVVTGTGPSGAGIPRVTVSNDSNILATQSGTWTVAQGSPNSLANGWPVEVTDGTNILGTATHPIRIDPTGVTIQPVSGTVAVTQSTSPWVSNITQFGSNNVVTGTGASGAGIPRVTVSNDSNILATQSGSWTVTANQGTPNTLANKWPVQVTDGTNTLPTGDAVGRAIFNKITDGTNGPVAVKAASTAPVFTDPALVAVISPNQQPIPVSAAPAGATTGVVFGRTIGAAGGAITAMRSTTYTEQTTNFTGSIKSTSANDTSAGTGARTVTITYYDQTGAGPLTETVTLNGTTAVNLVNANHCFIEKMVVITVGSNGSNAGTISLFTGSGGTGTNVGSIGVGNASNRGDNTTLWCHHYTPAGKTTSIYLINAGTTGNQDADISLYSIPVLTANAAEVKISDSIIVGGNSDSISRSSPNPIKVSGFARTTMYVVANGGNTAFTGGFDYADQ